MRILALIAALVACTSVYAQAFDIAGGTGGGAIADGVLSNNGPGAPTVITLTVSGTGLFVTSLTLAGAQGLAHTFAGDLTAVLAHGGVEVDLMDRNYRTTTTGFGLGGDLNGEYMFNEPAAGVGMSTGTTIAPGTYARWDNPSFGSSTAAGNYGGFVGMPLDGIWTLTFRDNAQLDTGSVQGMRIVGTAAVPEPATLAALGLGAVALIRRRRAKKS